MARAVHRQRPGGSHMRGRLFQSLIASGARLTGRIGIALVPAALLLAGCDEDQNMVGLPVCQSDCEDLSVKFADAGVSIGTVDMGDKD